MTESSKSKLWWVAGLLLRLLLVSILILVLLCAYLLTPIFLKLQINPRILLGLITACMIAGYAWAVYFRLPFFKSRTKRQRLLISASMALLPLFVVYGCLFVLASQFFQDMSRAQFVSPTNAENKIWFYDGGFMDRDLYFYAEPKGQKIQFVSSLWWWPDCSFSQAQWTKDGQVIVCSLNVKAIGNVSVLTAAFDFSENKAFAPSWITKNSCDYSRPESEWRKQELIIKGIIAVHGGLNDQKIDDGLLRKNEKTLWFWQSLP